MKVLRKVLRAIWRWHLGCWHEVKNDFKFFFSKEAWKPDHRQ